MGCWNPLQSPNQACSYPQYQRRALALLRMMYVFLRNAWTAPVDLGATGKIVVSVCGMTGSSIVC